MKIFSILFITYLATEHRDLKIMEEHVVKFKLIESIIVLEKPLKEKYTNWSSQNNYLIGELLGEYHKVETIRTLNIYISAYQAIIASFTKKLR